MTVAEESVDASLGGSDEPARERILSDLSTNMLVEVGAGSGKTTSLVGRMHALVVAGVGVESIAAVTFTRKAASELKERFQLKLESAVREAEAGSHTWRKCDRALRDIDCAFLGTIHSFCARILREHPLEAGLDPGFSELSENDWDELTQSFWGRWLERCKHSNDGSLDELASVGIDPRKLFDGFKLVMGFQDVEFPLEQVAEPDHAACRARLESLMTRVLTSMPKDEPPDGWDSLMNLVKRLEYIRRTSDWSKLEQFCGAAELINKSGCGIVQQRWSSDSQGKADAKNLGAEFITLLNESVGNLMTCWREHRYPAAMRFLRRASGAFERERHETGMLGFEDLLLLSARLLRDRPRLRDSLGARYRRLLVDEFQDTDPIQAEVCFLLASDSSQGDDWRRVRPRDGAIFLVGDPKQSIYRFRRADIQIYELAKSRMAECGAVLALTRNFRSVKSIATFVNGYFNGVFPESASDVQAQFTPMQAVNEVASVHGVSEYWVRPAKAAKASVIEADSAQVASWVAARLNTGEYTPGDFLILTGNRDPVAAHARALAERNVPVTTSGAKLPQEVELTELLVVLRAVADPDNPVAVVAALEGLFFGCGPGDLYGFREARGEFSITRSPLVTDSPVGKALLQLHEWWKLSQRTATDVLVDEILDDTGILCYAASQSLGDARAGALLRVVDTLREVSMTGASGVTDAIARVEIVLEQDSSDALLRPGRLDAVRVMNLHKAKGLEARVVILAAPVAETSHEPTVHVRRDGAGSPVGALIISSDKLVIAQPVGWAEMANVEAKFAAAEDQRLLYVATTRAKDELLISRCALSRAKNATESRQDASVWSPLGDALTELKCATQMDVTAAPGRKRVSLSAEEMAHATMAAEQRRRKASTSSISRRTVTQSVKDERDTEWQYDLKREGGRGTAWGRAVHRCVEAMGNGRDGNALKDFVAAVVADEGLEVTSAPELEALLSDVRTSSAWARLTKDGGARFELPVMRVATDSGMQSMTEGVIDAARLGTDGWYLVDWKTDTTSDTEWQNRRIKYEAQIAAYEEILQTLSGQNAQSEIQRVRTSPAEAD